MSEAGDETFIIAAILAMRQAKSAVFMGAMVALGGMTVSNLTLLVPLLKNNWLWSTNTTIFIISVSNFYASRYVVVDISPLT